MIEFNEGEKAQLRIAINRAIEGVDFAGIFSLKAFFDNIKIESIPGYLSIEKRKRDSWNTFVHNQKGVCTPILREGRNGLPKLNERHKDALRAFFLRLIDLGLLDQSNEKVRVYNGKVQAVIEKSPSS